jgi:hypothetical protein
MSDHHFWLSEAQFARLEPLLPNKPRGVPRVDDRRVISGIVHVIRGGLAHAVAAPKASVSAARSGTMFMYLRVDHLVPAMCLSLAAARFRQD